MKPTTTSLSIDEIYANNGPNYVDFLTCKHLAGYELVLCCYSASLEPLFQNPTRPKANYLSYNHADAAKN